MALCRLYSLDVVRSVVLSTLGRFSSLIENSSATYPLLPICTNVFSRNIRVPSGNDNIDSVVRNNSYRSESVLTCFLCYSRRKVPAQFLVEVQTETFIELC